MKRLQYNECDKVKDSTNMFCIKGEKYMHPMKVLIVDDEQDMRDLVQIYLENSGYHCYQADCAKRAHEILDVIPFLSLGR